MKSRLIAIPLALFGLAAAHAAPAWWTAGSEPAIDGSATPNNAGVVNTGQAKWMATRAFETLSDQLGATSPVVHAIEDELFKDTDTSTTGVFFPERPVSPSAEWLAALNNSDSAINKSVANVGQLKLVFSLDFSTLPPPASQFVTLPVHNSSVLLEEGVIIAFDIDALRFQTDRTLSP